VQKKHRDACKTCRALNFASVMSAPKAAAAKPLTLAVGSVPCRLPLLSLRLMWLRAGRARFVCCFVVALAATASCARVARLSVVGERRQRIFAAASGKETGHQRCAGLSLLKSDPVRSNPIRFEAIRSGTKQSDPVVTFTFLIGCWCTRPAMSNRNCLLSQELCHYLNQGRTLDDLLLP